MFFIVFIETPGLRNKKKKKIESEYFVSGCSGIQDMAAYSNYPRSPFLAHVTVYVCITNISNVKEKNFNIPKANDTNISNVSLLVRELLAFLGIACRIMN